MVFSCTSDSAEKSSQNQDKIRIGGSAEVYPILKSLAEHYGEKSDNVEIVFLPNSQTRGGIQGIKERSLDIGAVGRPVNPEEATGEIHYHHLTQNTVVLVAHQSAGEITNLTTEEIKKIYGGEIENWQEIGGEDAPIAIIDLPEDESEKQLLRKHYLGDTEVSDGAIVLNDESQLLEALSTTNYSIGAIPFSEELSESPVTILSLDGIAPSSENLAEGRYKMMQALGIVISSDRSNPMVNRFVEFTLSEEGEAIVREAIETEEE
ncbi:MAG: substrate-binding domain-containing protein [Cyanobacteria bacterium P01_E01_bin.42]